MKWISALYSFELIILLIFSISYILLQRKTITLLNSIPDDNGNLARQKKKINVFSLVHLASFFILAGLLCWGFINSIKEIYDFEKSHSLSRTIGSKSELEDRFYTKPSRSMFSESPSLWVFLKYPERGIDDYKKISEGPGELTGKVLINGKPAVGLSLKLIFDDGALGRDCVKTDDSGRYKISLPFAKYIFNAMIIEGEEISGKVSPQNEAPLFFKKGKFLEFKLDEHNHSSELPTIEVVDPVIPLTANYSIFDVTKTSNDKEVFAWKSFPEAVEYGVEVTRVEKKNENGNDSKSYWPDMKNKSFITKKTHLTFEQFKDLPEIFEPGVYGIRIFAYGKDKRSLSYSREFCEIAFNDSNSSKVKSK